MSKIAVQIESSCSFSDYFKLNYETEDVINYFGYSYRTDVLNFAKDDRELDRLSNLDMRIRESIPYVSFNNEIARRELLIAPVVIDLIHYTRAKLRIGYGLKANDQLRGELDYYIEAQNSLLVIEAKNADLQKGFTQLAAELIAVDKLVEGNAKLFGAVSTGNIWQFGFLNRIDKEVVQDFNLYRVPTDLEELLRIAIAMLVTD
jgi:hypothetical protein